ncbi:MAG: FHA domain-containing protein [Proteobacteria bacterium]|nr:FHA domain-containing protein [Pseudomonadota bacterium]
MSKLTLSMDGLLLKEIPLVKERTTIGRKPHNDIQIDNLAISGEHAVIVTILNDAFLEDLDSTNGTHVNGQPVKKHFLQNGDVIELGKYRLKYLSEAQQQTSQADFEKTMIIRPGMMPKAAGSGDTAAMMAETQAAMPALQQPAAERPRDPPLTAEPPAAPLRGAIQILTGANAGKEMELTKTLSTLGKPGVQVAVIARRPHGYFITHVEGASFPSVNGKLLDAQAHPLLDHDIIELAGVKMEFFLKD